MNPTLVNEMSSRRFKPFTGVSKLSRSYDERALSVSLRVL